MDPEEVGCEYIDYESLLEPNESIPNILNLIHSESWKENFFGINLLRSLNKFKPTETIEPLNSIFGKICVFIDSPRSSLAKNALLLMSECLLSFQPDFVPLAIQISQLLLLKSVNEKSFIRAEALKSLQNLSNNYFSVLEVVSFFQKNCFHKSASVSQNAFNCLRSTLTKIDPEKSFEICLALEDCKRQGILLGAKDHIKYLSVNWSEFNTAVEKLDERHKKIIQLMLAEKKKRSTLKDTIQKSREIKTFLSCEGLLE